MSRVTESEAYSCDSRRCQVEERGTYQPYRVRSIKAPADPARETINPARLGELADSIAAEGLHQPVGVVLEPDGAAAVLAWGHRRLLAVRLLGWEWIDAKVFPTGTDLTLARWSENGQRADLNPLEEAHEVRRAMARGIPTLEICRQFRRSAYWLKDRLELLELPEDLQACIRDHSLSTAVVRALKDIDNDEYRASLIHQAVTHGATAAVCEVWRAHYLSDRDRIVSNTVALSQLAAERVAFKILVPCDWCQEDVAVERSRAWRLCDSCHAEVTEARRGVMPTQD